MKMVTFVVNPLKLDALKKLLWDQGFKTATLTASEGLGLQKGSGDEIFTAVQQPRVKLELAIKDAALDALLEAALEALRTGRVGDGKIFVSELGQAVRVRTGERGDSAL